jgi:hypothetical protein
MKKILVPLLIVLLIALSGTAFYLYKKANALNTTPGASNDSDKILASVRSLILLPEGEVPTIATVTDLEKLKDQPFFKKAKVGDKVIMYPKAKKAYLYDSENNKILEVAPIALDTQINTPTAPVTNTPVTPAAPVKK